MGGMGLSWSLLVFPCGKCILTCTLETTLAAGAGRSVTTVVPCLRLSTVMGGFGDTSAVAPLLPELGFWEPCHSMPWGTKRCPHRLQSSGGRMAQELAVSVRSAAPCASARWDLVAGYRMLLAAAHAFHRLLSSSSLQRQPGHRERDVLGVGNHAASHRL